MSELYVGIDIGTSNTKVIAVNSQGEVQYAASRGYPLHTPQDGYVEQDPELVVEAAVESLKELASMAQPQDRFVAASFSSAMHSVLLLDEENAPLTNVITWADTRSRDVAHALKEMPEGYAIYRKTGTPIHPMTPFCKLAWLTRYEQELMEKTRRVVSIKAYLFFKLFGEFVVDHSIASATGMFDIFSRTWDDLALRYAGLADHHLSRPVPALYKLGPLTERFANELAAYSATVFCAGASDGCLANYGLGVMDSSHAALTIGTSGAIRVTCAEPATDPESRLFTYILDDQLYVTGGSMNSGGILMQWFRDHMLDGEDASFMQLMEKAGTVPAGSEGLICLPYLLGERAPHWNSYDKGVYFGVSYQHTQAHFLRALMEGVAYNFLQIVEAMEELFGPIGSILATGGFLKSPIWVQILADVLNKPVLSSTVGDASAVGAAFMAMRATGLEKNPSLSITSDANTRYTPNPAHREVYTHGLPFFKSLYQKLQPAFSHPSS
ncbi:MAG: gluconokinase [Rhodothermaceae bacterium]|nr:gluconokinase [Rhodothermaceae bacterium]